MRDARLLCTALNILPRRECWHSLDALWTVCTLLNIEEARAIIRDVEGESNG